MDRRTTPSRGSAVGHIRHAVTSALREIAVSGLICLVLGGALTEVVAYLLTGSLPGTPTHVAAAVIALACGYGAAVTAALRAVLRSLGASMEWVLSEVERVAGGAIHEAESVLHVQPERPQEPGEPGEPVAARARGIGGSADGMASGLIGGIPAEPPRGA